ncbi:hypothetical protein [Mangrovicoccus algicola]|uniref:Uncharacterized protein n=1 Tax=Mangrovicoccus algicola TaxID=2771008 RepID=A0A8J6Z4D5_9RHOB|nr:hypothetical protein [Mangrovicoccus algicola]MBE3637359.1 hypothetical protein [Mangrovicoccus algicola]
MCDVQSFLSMGQSLVGGQLNAADARLQGDLQAMNAQTATVLAGTQAIRQRGQLRRDFDRQAGQNRAAMAVSGLATESFAGVEAGNREDLARAMGQIDSDLATETASNDAQARIAQAQARRDASLALWSGRMDAIQTGVQAAQNFAAAGMGSSGAGGGLGSDLWTYNTGGAGARGQQNRNRIRSFFHAGA